MEQTESVNISINEWEASTSVQNTLQKAVRVGPKSVELFTRSADSLSNSSISWTVPVSDSSLLSRRLIAEIPISVVIDSGTNGDNMRNVYLNPRADLNRIFSSVSLRVNGSNIVSSPEQYAVTLLNYTRSDEMYHDGGILSSNANVPDILYSNNLSFEGTEDSRPDNALKCGMEAYHFRTRSYDMSYPPRSVASPFKKYGVTGIATTGHRAVGFTFFIRVALKHDLLSSSSKECLANINSLEVQCNINQAYIKHKLFHMCIPRNNVAVLTEANVTANIGQLESVGAVPNQTFTFKLSAQDFTLSGIIVNPMNQDIPETVLVPSSGTFLTFDYPIGAVNNGSSQTVVHSNIVLSTVPSYIFLSVIPQEQNLSLFRSDYNPPITNLNIVINNRSYPFELWQQKDFYQTITANGYSAPFNTFDSSKETTKYGNLTGAFQQGESSLGTGSALCFRPSSDFGMELKEALNENFRCEVRFTVHNTSGVDMSFTSRINFLIDTLFVCQRGSGIKQLTGVSTAEYEDALNKGNILSLTADENGEDSGLKGGSNFSNMFKDFSRGFVRGLRLSAGLLRSAAEIYPESGLGQAVYEGNRGMRMVEAINQQTGLGAGSYMGGSSRLQMLKASGVLR